MNQDLVDSVAGGDLLPLSKIQYYQVVLLMIILLLTGAGCDEGSKPGFSSCCVPKAVRCGTHNRDNCGQCPFDVHPNGFVMVFSHWCNGDCKWQEGNLLSMLWVEMDHPIKFYRKRIRREDLRHFQCRSSILSYR